MQKKSGSKNGQPHRTLGPVSDLERYLPSEWWKTLFNSLYLKTDGDVFENNINTQHDIDLLLNMTQLQPNDTILDLCCGQGRHSLELASRGYQHIIGIDRSRYLLRLARKRAKSLHLSVNFSEGDARKFRIKEKSVDCAFILGNSFGYFERQEDDLVVLNNLKKILASRGKLVLDIVDGEWMRAHFEPRSWEWIDQEHFVNRERSLSSDGQRLITREVITHADKGVIADQFYAERLYSLEEITAILHSLGFEDIQHYQNTDADSARKQDMGMMANRLFICARAPFKENISTPILGQSDLITVVMDDPQQGDPLRKNGVFNPEDFESIDILKEALHAIPGVKYTFLNDHAQLIADLKKNSPAFVLNLCDAGFNNIAEQELHICALFEMLQIPYTGAGPRCLALCYNKSFVRAIAQNVEIPVPLETFCDPADQSAHIPHIFPALLKPNMGDASLGITQDALVHNAEELINYMHYLHKKLPHTPILIQEFLSGAEYSVGLLGNKGKLEALPLLEVDYSALPENLPKILCYESKWLPDSIYWKNIQYKEAELSDEQSRKLIDYASTLFERLDCRDYARFDFRKDKNGNIKFLEANPNPGWTHDAKMNLMAGFAGMTYSQLLERILQTAKERLGLP